MWKSIKINRITKVFLLWNFKWGCIQLIVSSILFFSCQNDDVQNEPLPIDEVIHIPVVVHVVNMTSAPFEISDAKIHSQIEVLNKDYRKKNSDYINTPNEFIDLVADVGIEFHLAIIDPNGDPTSGIIRTESDDVSGFDGRNLFDEPIEDLKLYFSDKGGQDAWPNDRYLNIWIADMSDRFGNVALAGYANPPGSDPRIDGVVIDPRVFGTLPPLIPNYDLGRTATHEIGHWLNLLHIYAGEGNCESTDFVEDTPSQKGQYEGSPNHPQFSCGSNDMFMNFMDRVNDNAMYMFTKGQKERMRALFEPGGKRWKLYDNNRD